MYLFRNFPSHIPKIHSNIIFPSTSMSSEWLFLSGFQTKSTEYTRRHDSVAKQILKHLAFIYTFQTGYSPQTVTNVTRNHIGRRICSTMLRDLRLLRKWRLKSSVLWRLTHPLSYISVHFQAPATFRKVGVPPHHYTVSHPRRPRLECSTSLQ
jgi:hypothetical protein